MRPALQFCTVLFLDPDGGHMCTSCILIKLYVRAYPFLYMLHLKISFLFLSKSITGYLELVSYTSGSK